MECVCLCKQSRIQTAREYTELTTLALITEQQSTFAFSCVCKRGETAVLCALQIKLANNSVQTVVLGVSPQWHDLSLSSHVENNCSEMIWHWSHCFDWKQASSRGVLGTETNTGMSIAPQQSDSESPQNCQDHGNRQGCRCVLGVNCGGPNPPFGLSSIQLQLHNRTVL